MEFIRFDSVNDIKIDYNIKSAMWKALYDWNSIIGIWHNTPFNRIDVENISK